MGKFLHSRWLPPVALFCVATLIYSVISRGHLIPDWTIDEILYGEMAKGIAAGHGATWRGHGLGISAVYSYVISPAWMLFQPTTAYAVARIIGVALACSTVIPVWLASSELTTGWRVWIAPVGTLLGTWMIIVTRLLTENLAWPLSAWCLACLIVCLARGRAKGWLLASIVFALLATATRLQLLILLPVIPAALILDLLRNGSFTAVSRARASMRGSVASIASVPVLTLLITQLPVGSLLGRYSGITAKAPSVATVIYWTFQNFLELALMTGIVPVVVLLALAARRSNWSDRRIGALLCVAIPMLLVTVIETGWFSASHTQLLIDRYLIYTVPFVLMAVALAAGRVSGLAAATASVFVGLSVITMPIPNGMSLFTDGFESLTNLTVGANVIHSTSTLTIFAVIVTLVGFLGTTLAAITPDPKAVDGIARAKTYAAPASCVMIAAILLSSSAWNWHSIEGRNADLASAGYPAQRDWIDRATPDAVSMILLSRGVRDQAYITELFNNRIKNAYVAPPLPAQSAGDGIACRIKIALGGELIAPGCARPSNSLFLLGKDSQMTFTNSVSVTQHLAHDATLVKTSGSPKLQSFVTVGCPQQPLCAPLATIRLWVHGPATLKLKIQTSAKPLNFKAATRTVTVPPHSNRLVRLPYASAPQSLALKTPLPVGPAQVDAIKSISLVTAGHESVIFSSR
jgi:hypothetical protein